jgi:putative FmdB family regulatory protein
MPLYEYICALCGERFECIRAIAEKDETECPKCGHPARRLLSSFALGGHGDSSSVHNEGVCFGGG